MPFHLRPAQADDLPALQEVEKLSTPSLTYLPYVFEQFRRDPGGELSVAEDESGRLVGCGKFTRLPDGSAWLETLRVIPACQGQGVGKLFYQRFLETARAQGITTLRMYTGVENLTSRGLAERFGFTLAETLRGYRRPSPSEPPALAASGWHALGTPASAAPILAAQRAAWGPFLVLNRTFYPLSSALAELAVQQGWAFQNADSGDFCILGARFMPQQALHLGLLSGNLDGCLTFALQQAYQRSVPTLICTLPASASAVQAALIRHGFQPEPADLIVMEAHFPEYAR